MRAMVSRLNARIYNSKNQPSILNDGGHTLHVVITAEMLILLNFLQQRTQNEIHCKSACLDMSTRAIIDLLICNYICV